MRKSVFRLHQTLMVDSSMAAQLIDGKAVAETLINRVREGVDARVAAGKRAPALAVILVGDDPASGIYVKNKKRSCEKAGVRSVAYDLPGSTSQEELLSIIETLNADDGIDGILVHLPLPKQSTRRSSVNPKRMSTVSPVQRWPPGHQDAAAAPAHPARRDDAAGRVRHRPRARTW
jgi:methylenetetrahydrofolate dehydrogenase (NADP+)/methenyltetrahydrofolate cyclohydrolase